MRTFFSDKLAQISPGNREKIKQTTIQFSIDESAKQLIYLLADGGVGSIDSLQTILRCILPQVQILLELENQNNPRNSKAFQAFLDSKEKYSEVYRRLAES